MLNVNDDRFMINNHAGVAFIELLLVISVISILSVSMTPFLSNFILRNNLITTTDKVIATVRKAQHYAMDGKNNTTWGICLFENKLRLFSGSCISPIIFEDFTISRSVTISGLNETTFSKLRGEPSTALTVLIRTDIDSKTVTVNAVGGMEIN